MERDVLIGPEEEPWVPRTQTFGEIEWELAQHALKWRYTSRPWFRRGKPPRHFFWVTPGDDTAVVCGRVVEVAAPEPDPDEIPVLPLPKLACREF